MYIAPRRNMVKFTPVQFEAIVAGMTPGLTLVVGTYNALFIFIITFT